MTLVVKRKTSCCQNKCFFRDEEPLDDDGLGCDLEAWDGDDGMPKGE